MINIYLVKRIFKASGYTPNRTLISKIFKDRIALFYWTVVKSIDKTWNQI